MKLGHYQGLVSLGGRRTGVSGEQFDIATYPAEGAKVSATVRIEAVDKRVYEVAERFACGHG